MNTPCITPCVAISLHRPWWQRLFESWLERPVRTARARPEPALPDTWHEGDLRDLRHLSAATLRDIGAPDWVHETRERSRASDLDLLRL